MIDSIIDLIGLLMNALFIIAATGLFIAFPVAWLLALALGW